MTRLYTQFYLGEKTVAAGGREFIITANRAPQYTPAVFINNS